MPKIISGKEIAQDLRNKLKNIKVICMCTIKENEKFQYFPLQYNDKLTNYSSK